MFTPPRPAFAIDRPVQAGENAELWSNQDVQAQVLGILRTVMLPSLSLIDCNPGVMMELWHVLGDLSCPMRYGLYANWISGAGQSCPEVLKAEAVASHEMKQLLKRISSDKKKLKHDARMVPSRWFPFILFPSLSRSWQDR